MSKEGAARRVYQLLLRLFPSDFRRRWGTDMEAVFRHRLEQAGEKGGPRTWVWIRSAVDVLSQAVAEWWATIRKRVGVGKKWKTGSLRSDLRYAVRALAGAPTFTLIAVGTLALGIGASSATYSVVHAVLLCDLPYRDPGRLVVTWPERNHNKAMIHLSDQAAPALESVSGISLWTLTLTGEREPMELSGAVVSAHHFELLGADPALGRTFSLDDGVPGNGGVAVLSYGLWLRVFGADPEVLGRTIALSGHDHDRRTVIGVMPPSFRPVFGRPQVWVPLEVDPLLPFEADDSWFVNRRVARLGPGATLVQANQQIRSFAVQLRERAPSLISEEQAQTASVQPLRDFMAGSLGRVLWVVMGAVSLVLLVACANVANLLLSRGEARARDLAVRAALGAGRNRILRMLLAESTIVGLAGGTLGVLLSVGLVRILVALAPATFPRVDEVMVNGSVLLFALAATVTCTFLAGLMPAFNAARADVSGTLGKAQRGASNRRSTKLSTSLVGVQLAMAALVAVGSGLMLRSLDHLLEVDPGLDGSGVLTFRPNPPGARYPDGLTSSAYYEGVLQRIRALSDVESAGAIHLLPGTSGTWNFPTFPEGVEYADGTPATSINFRGIWPGYFETVRIPLLSGRYLRASDREDAENVVIVNKAFVDLFWPGENALGKHLRLFEPTASPFRVVGVVGDVRQHSRADQPKPEMYFTARQWGSRLTMWIMVRTRGDGPLDHAAAVRDAVWALDRNVPVSNLQELSAVLGSSTETTRFLAVLLSAFGGLALVLGAVGVFSVTSYTVGRRTPEFGVRIALGSSRLGVFHSAVGQTLAPAAVGLFTGLAGAAASTNVLESVLFEVEPTDLPTFASVALVLAGVATLASLVPAWRAMRVDPVQVLNSE